MSNREAARQAGLDKSTAYNMEKRAGIVFVLLAEQQLATPTFVEQISRIAGSGRPKVLSDEDCMTSFKACTQDKKSRMKQQHHVSLEEGFEACRRVVKQLMRKIGLYRNKSTKKPGLTDVRKAQRFEIPLSRKD